MPFEPSPTNIVSATLWLSVSTIETLLSEIVVTKTYAPWAGTDTPCAPGPVVMVSSPGRPGSGTTHEAVSRRRRGGLPPAASLAADMQMVAHGHSFTPRSRAALAITLTEDSAIAAAAMIGDSRRPKNG